MSKFKKGDYVIADGQYKGVVSNYLDYCDRYEIRFAGGISLRDEQDVKLDISKQKAMINFKKNVLKQE
jgi:hypothetical protein